MIHRFGSTRDGTAADDWAKQGCCRIHASKNWDLTFKGDPMAQRQNGTTRARSAIRNPGVSWCSWNEPIQLSIRKIFTCTRTALTGMWRMCMRPRPSQRTKQWWTRPWIYTTRCSTSCPRPALWWSNIALAIIIWRSPPRPTLTPCTVLLAGALVHYRSEASRRMQAAQAAGHGKQPVTACWHDPS